MQIDEILHGVKFAAGGHRQLKSVLERVFESCSVNMVEDSFVLQ